MQNNTTAQIVNHLFDRLMAINPAWKQAWPTEEEFKSTKKEWVLAFIDANINTIEQLKSGLKKVRMKSSPFIPSPGEFIELCKPTPDDIGAPSVEDAYNEACGNALPYITEKKWSHDVVRYASHKTGTDKLRSEPRSKSFDLFRKNYDDAIELYSSGKVMNQISNSKTIADYQEYVGRLVSDINLALISPDTKILSFSEWLR